METILDEAARHLRNGRAVDALRVALLASMENPADARAPALAAAASHALGRPEDGMRWFRAAMALDSFDPEFGCGLAACQFDLKLPRAARTTLESVLQRHPTHLQAWRNLAVACEADNAPEAAARALEEAALLAPSDDEVLRARAALALRGGDTESALRFSAAALVCKPDHPETLHLLLGAALTAGRIEPAIAAASQLLVNSPGDAFARRGQAAAFSMQGSIDQASAIAAGLPVELRTGFDARLIFLVAGAAALRSCDWSGMPAWLDAAARFAKDDNARLDATEFPVQALAAGLEQHLCSALFTAHVRDLQARQPALKWPRPKRLQRTRLRIGYIGAGFGEHPSAMLVNPVLAAHDRSRFEVFAYALTADDGNHWRAETAANVDAMRGIAHMNAAESAGLILSDDIDVLVDLSGMLEFGRPDVHFHRPARVHLLLFGTPALFPLPGIDAMVGDAIVFETQDAGLRLPGCYLPIDPRWAAWARSANAPTRRAHGLPEAVPVLCCFNNAYKIEPSAFSAWMRVLKRCPETLFWLLESGIAARDNLRAQAVRAGIDPVRLIFAPRLPLADHLKRMRLADAFLDTFHYGAHVTGVQALAAGLPLLTIQGDRFAARVGASALTHAGLADMVATDVDDYVERAVQFCRRTPAALQWRARVEAAFSEACCETRFMQHVRSLENIYENAFLLSTGKR